MDKFLGFIRDALVPLAMFQLVCPVNVRDIRKWRVERLGETAPVLTACLRPQQAARHLAAPVPIPIPVRARALRPRGILRAPETASAARATSWSGRRDIPNIDSDTFQDRVRWRLKCGCSGGSSSLSAPQSCSTVIECWHDGTPSSEQYCATPYPAAVPRVEFNNAVVNMGSTPGGPTLCFLEMNSVDVMGLGVGWTYFPSVGGNNVWQGFGVTLGSAFWFGSDACGVFRLQADSTGANPSGTVVSESDQQCVFSECACASGDYCPNGLAGGCEACPACAGGAPRIGCADRDAGSCPCPSGRQPYDG